VRDALARTDITWVGSGLRFADGQSFPLILSRFGDIALHVVNDAYIAICKRLVVFRDSVVRVSRCEAFIK